MKKQIYAVWALAMLLLSACGYLPMGGGDENFALTVVHMNDSHSFIDAAPLKIAGPGNQVFTVETADMARTVSKVAQLREEHPNMLFLHGGDMTQGTFYSMLYHGESDLYFFNRMKLGGMVTGNHEYDRGSEPLSSLLRKAEFPVTVANVQSEDDPFLKDSFEPYIIRTINNEPVGIIGLVTSETPKISSPSDQLIFLEEAATAQRVIDQLEDKGVNKIILLTHIYYENDKKLAQQVHGADIIVGGHSHTLLGDFHSLGLATEGEYPTVMKGLDGEPVLVVQAWEYGKMLGVLETVFDSDGHIRSFQGEPTIVISDTLRNESGELLTGESLVAAQKVVAEQPGLQVFPRDKQAAAQAAIYKQGIAEFEAKVVGRADSSLPHVRKPTETLPGGSLIAPIVCDAFLWKARSLGIEADVVIQNSGGVRIDINEGPITVADVYTLLPFRNTMAVVEVSGNELRQLFETVLSGVYDTVEGDGAFPYVAGMRYGINKDGPKGQRLFTMELQLPSGDWQPLEGERIYQVVTNQYLASGKSGYDILGAKGVSQEISFFDSDIFIEYLGKVGHVGPVAARISVE